MSRFHRRIVSTSHANLKRKRKRQNIIVGIWESEKEWFRFAELVQIVHFVTLRCLHGWIRCGER